MKTVKNKVAAITGAGSGIGRATALLLAKRGCHVAISDVNEEGLHETLELLRPFGTRVSATRVDVSDRSAVERWADEVAREFGAVHIIVNNAGVAVGATVEDTTYEDFEWLMNINFWGVVYGTKAFLPHLRAAGEGHVVNISSVFGLIAVPTQSAYNAAKFAVKGFTESLRVELDVDGQKIGATCVHPGGIKTNIARNATMTLREGWVSPQSSADFEKLFQTTPEDAAKEIYAAILKNQRRLLIGKDAVFIDLMQRTLPTLYQRLLGALARRQREAMKKAGTTEASSTQTSAPPSTTKAA